MSRTWMTIAAKDTPRRCSSLTRARTASCKVPTNAKRLASSGGRNLWGRSGILVGDFVMAARRRWGVASSARIPPRLEADRMCGLVLSSRTEVLLNLPLYAPISERKEIGSLAAGQLTIGAIGLPGWARLRRRQTEGSQDGHHSHGRRCVARTRTWMTPHVSARSSRNT